MIDRPPRLHEADGHEPAAEKSVLLLVARHDDTPPPAASLAGRLRSALGELRARIEPRRFVLPWAAGASLLAIMLLIERRQVQPAGAPAMTMADAPPVAPVKRAVPLDLAPPLPPGLAGAPPPLVGIVGRLPDDAVALVRKPDGRTRTLGVGAVFDGWTLASLDRDEAVFERRGQRVTVALPPPDQ